VIVFVAFGASATLIGRALTDQAAMLPDQRRLSSPSAIADGRAAPTFCSRICVSPEASAGWTVRCVCNRLGVCVWLDAMRGPILAAILALAANDGSIGHGSSCWPRMVRDRIAVLGRGVRVRAVHATDGALARTDARGRGVVGSLMVVTGALVFTGSIANVGGWLLQQFPALGRVG